MAITILEWKTEFNDTQRLESDVAPIIQGDANIFGYWTDAQSVQQKIYASALNLGTPASNFTYMFGVLVFPSSTEVRLYVNGSTLQRRDNAVQNNGVYSVAISQIIVNDVNVPHNMSNYFTTGTTQILQRYEGLPLYEKSEIQDYYDQTCSEPAQKITSNGGGATHIAKRTGQLKDLSSNLSDILMVSGGGGGGLLVNTIEYTGKEAGGISGSGDNSADQTTGNAFGLGESGTDVSGGGSGLYGGYKGTSSKSGGAGSGYIGNSLLSNKKMVGYNVPTSSAEGTKTESVNEVSASAISGKPKSGNGVAKIKFLRDLDVANMQEWIPDGAFGWQVTYDSETKENHITGQCNQFWEYYEFPLDVERNKNYTVSLQFKGSNYNYFALYDTLRVLDRWLDATQIQQEDGINYNYVIAESDTHFSNQSNYVDCSVTFNSGNRDKVWLYIGAGYVWTSTWMDLYFKNITVVKND